MCALLVALACGSSEPTTVDVDGPAILVFSRTEGYRHASIGPGIEALRSLAAEDGLQVVATENPAEFTPERLDLFKAVVFLSTTGDVLDADQESALEAYIRAGGGFAGIHSASDTEYDWPWYGALVGGYFDGHPPVQEATLLVAEADHPATDALPSPWERVDEWYDIRDLQPGLTVLLEIDETTYKDEGAALEPRPIAWTRDFDGGRSFYTALGHTTESWSEPLFLEHVWGGITSVLRESLP